MINDRVPNLTKEFKLKAYELVEQVQSFDNAMNQLVDELTFSAPQSYIDFTTFYSNFCQQKRLEEKLKNLRFNISDQNLALMPEYRQRVDVLKCLNYVDSEAVVQLKGSVV